MSNGTRSADGSGRPLGWPPPSYWMKVTAGVLLVFALARMVAQVQGVLILLLVSVVLAIGLQPAVDSLVRRGFRRGWAVTTIALGGFAILGGFLALILPVVIDQVGGLVDTAPDYLRRAQEGSGLIAELNERFDLNQKLQDLQADVPSTAVALIRSFTAFLFNTLTVVILTLYFTSAMPRIRHGLARLMKRDDRESFEAILEESTRRVGGYLIGNLIISLIAGVVYFVFMITLGIPYAAALAFWVALTDLIPTVGAFLGAGLIAIVALFVGVPQFVVVIIFSIIYQQIENYIIGPRVMRQAIEMSAAAIIVALLVGGSLLGFAGALLALPMAAIVKIAAHQLYVRDRIETIREHDTRDGGEALGEHPPEQEQASREPGRVKTLLRRARRNG